MLNCFVDDAKKTIPIILIPLASFADWLKTQSDSLQNWMKATQFKPEAGSVRLIPEADGTIKQVICCVADQANLWDVGFLPYTLSEDQYRFDVADKEFDEQYIQYAIAWGLGAYQFTRYKKPTKLPAQLYLPPACREQIENIVASIYLVRDAINAPTDDMGPSEFAALVVEIAKQYQAEVTQIIGEDLLKKNYASIYTVGRASDDAPRLVDLHWGNKQHPKVTLVGKGVCFDSGGLDIKPSSYMLLMKKDMAGGAHVLGLARMIMQAKLPVYLRVLIPMVENVIAGNAYRPGDIIKSRKGLTIEVGNTDAEGRVILADELTEAVSESPDLLIDIATLTGAARVALGTELPALFSNHNQIANELIQQGDEINDPMWRLPLFALYRDYIASNIADINNNSVEPYAGAITAALFLKEFVPDEIPWLHFDMMAWNLRTRPGRPQGGEAMALRALFAYLQKRYVTAN